MRNLKWSLMAAILAAAGILMAEDENKGQVRGKTTAVNVEKGPAIDGTMSDPVWQKCPELPLGACASDSWLKYKTWGRILFDGTHVYVGMFCEDPDTDNLAAKVTDRDGNVWGDDSVEIFIHADPEKPYCQFTINPKGVFFDAREGKKEWNSSAEIKTSVEKGKGWTLTFRVPMAEVGAYVGDDELWTMNLNRTRQGRGGDALLEYSWSVMNSTSYQAPQEFGTVSGVKVPKREDGVTRVRAEPPPKPAIADKGTEVGGVVVYQKILFNENESGWQASDGSKLSMTDDACDGKALRIECKAEWGGAQLPINVSGSSGLKMAFHMKGKNVATAGCNVFDKAADDNTTSYGCRYLQNEKWTPVLYYLYRFHYNGKDRGYVGGRTAYTSVRFFGPSKPAPDSEMVLDDFILYRGTDKQAPAKVTDLKAEAGKNGVKLSWKAAEDNVGAMVYVVSRAEGNGAFAKIAEVCPTSYLDSTAGKATYRYRVFAVDYEENFGPWSDPVTVKCKAEPKPQDLTNEEKDRAVYAQHVKEVHAKGVGRVNKMTATLFGDSLTGATVYPQCTAAALLNLTVDAFGFPAMGTGFGKGHAPTIVKNQNPEFLLILFGTNNSKAPAAIPPAMDDLAGIVKTAEENGTVAILGRIPPKGFKDPEAKPEAEFNKSVSELSAKLQIPTAYIFDGIMAGGDRKKFLSNDGVHWVEGGMEAGGKAWGAAMEQVHFVLRDQP